MISEKSRAEFVIATFVDSSWKSALNPSYRKVNVNIQEQFVAKEEDREQMSVPEDDEEVYESDPEPSAVSTDSLFKRLKEI